MDDIEKDLDDCSEVADLIEIYKIPTTQEDTEGYAVRSLILLNN